MIREATLISRLRAGLDHRVSLFLRCVLCVVWLPGTATTLQLDPTLRECTVYVDALFNCPCDPFIPHRVETT
ncbi:MAG: hypothetical protein J3R72DRAFT_442178 [Linnemannia gamsii]|nr:MAG: hypothetical protein J3R72DRAFT_442178 [Linnemannia gamsii]